MSKRRLTDVQEREVALSHLCHVSPEYIRGKWGVSDANVRRLILKERSPNWNDPLVEFYKQVRQSGNYWDNAAHLYLVFENQAEGLPKIELVDKKRDANVYEAVDNDIFDPKTQKLVYEDTGLGKIILEHPKKEKPEVKMLNVIFGSFENNQINRIVMPYLYQRLRESYQKGNINISKVYSEVKKDVLSYLQEALIMRGDKETKEFYDSRQAEILSELKGKLENVLDTLTYREREIIKLRYGLGDGFVYNLEETGKMFKVTIERVRQIEAKAIRKLQHPIRSRLLEVFLEGYEDKPSVHSLKKMGDYTPEQRDLIFNSSVQDFELSTRAMNILRKSGIKTIRDLCSTEARFLLSLRNCGEITLNEIKETILRPYGLEFSMLF